MSPWITKVDCFVVELSYHHLPGMPSSNYVIDSSWAGKSIHQSVWLGTYPKRHKKHVGNGGTALTINSVHFVKSFVHSNLWHHWASLDWGWKPDWVTTARVRKTLPLHTSQKPSASVTTQPSADPWSLRWALRMAQRSPWVWQGINERWRLLTHPSEATCLWKHAVLSKYSSDEEQNAAWAKCGSDEMQSKLVMWQSHVFLLKPLTHCSCQIGPRLHRLY